MVAMMKNGCRMCTGYTFPKNKVGIICTEKYDTNRYLETSNQKKVCQLGEKRK